MIERITDQTEFDEEKIATSLSNGYEVVIQYSKDIYNPTILKQIDALALRHGENLQVRFFGHYNTQFDFEILEHLPSVQNLAVDCLNNIKHIEALHQLKGLRRFTIGANDKLPIDLLESPALIHLRKLILSDSKTKKLRLHPVANMHQLQWLHLTGYSNGIEILSEANSIENLSLSQIGNRVKLKFLNSMSGLLTLSILLGGREDISEVWHDKLQNLKIIRVRGLSSLNPDAFPSLSYLNIEDQIRLEELKFSRKSAKLEEIKIINCKGLKFINGLSNLAELARLLISRTNIDIESILTQELPKKLEVFGFYEQKESSNRLIREKLDALGYRVR